VRNGIEIILLYTFAVVYDRFTMIEFQYFKGCPHAKDTLHNLREVMTEMGIGENELQIINVPSPEAAQKIKFQGSPTILFNGIDIFTGEKPVGLSYSCRVYEFDGKQIGVIPKEFIWRRLEGYELKFNKQE
jgi:hypothetical protein